MIINKQGFWEILKGALETDAPSGREENIIKYISNHLSNKVNIMERCGMGSLIVNTGKKKGLKILIDSHCDEVGFLIREIKDNGFIKFTPVGGVWGHAILSQRLEIITRKNKRIRGIVGSKPVHIITVQERNRVIKPEDMYLDIGVSSKKEVLDLGINIGNAIVKKNDAWRMSNKDYFSGKSIDNRYGVAVVISLFKELASEQLENDIYGIFSTQEEVGLRGVKTATNMVRPDIAIVVDTTLSYDQPGMEKNETKIGTGVALEVMDASSVSHKGFFKFMEKLCLDNKVKFTYSCLDAGGTNAGNVYHAGKGVTTMVLSLPTRYLHSHNEVGNINDGLETIKLLKLFIKTINEKYYQKILNYDF